MRGEIPALPQDKLNILLVIARPYGDRDIGLKTIARPLLGTIAEALQRFEEAFKIFQDFQDWYKVPLALMGIGHILEKQLSWTEAVRSYLQALNIDLQHNQEWFDLLIEDLAQSSRFWEKINFKRFGAR